MTDQELAKRLLLEGVLTAEQVKAAAHERHGKGFAQVIIERGWASLEQVLSIDPQAVLQAPHQAENEAPLEPPTPPSSPETPEAPAMEVGLGQNDTNDYDDTGVVIHGEEDRIDDSNLGAIIIYTNQLLEIAVQLRASDLHLEPREDGLLPRYRVDGQLHSGSLVPAELMPPILSRFKVLSNLDITEQRMPQDGRFRATVAGHIFDFRVSTLPTVHGEKIVIRLLDRSALVTDLRMLGLQDDTRQQFEAMLHRSQGMVLVTGPTGSGKTTTLYAALATTRDETRNVITVEDPVEYNMEGVSQSNVDADIGLTFATQLRAILRQDPDVILVGEIRDSEAADIAIRAALTGHLVLSTLHTNSAVAAITRMQDMGIAPFLIASSFSGVLAQRLVRMICRQCRQPLPEDTAEYQDAIVRLSLEPGFPLFYGMGCEHCNHTGNRGRIAIIELLPVEREIRRAIMNQTHASELRDIAVRHGMRTLWQDGLEKLRRGLTTADEVARVLLGTEDAEEEPTEKKPAAEDGH